MLKKKKNMFKETHRKEKETVDVKHRLYDKEL